MDENHQKALWFRGLSYVGADDLDNAIKTLNKLCEVVPDDADFKKELARVKALKLAFQKK